MSSKVYGIDLGTTYSCVSRINKHGLPEVIENQFDNTSTTPSVVYFSEGEEGDEPEVIIGAAAKQEAMMEPERAASTFKRHMHKDDWTFTVDGRAYTPVDLSSILLKEITARASEQIGEEIENVVITVPAYFGARERLKTEQAGKDAGLNVVDIIPEPMAAALSYELDREDDGAMTVLVYDLGGGTFDVTIMEFDGQSKTSLAHRGDPELGGALWDEDLARYWAEAIGEESGDGFDVVWDTPETREELLQKAEATKQRLTTGKAEQKNAVSYNAQQYRPEIDLETFDSITEGRLGRTIDLVEEAIEIARKKRADMKIDTILLVGGSSLMPQVRRRLERVFGGDVAFKLHNPHLAVALGAAVYAQKREVDAWIKDYVALTLSSEDGSPPADDVVERELSNPDSELTRDAITKAAAEYKRAEADIMTIRDNSFIDVAPKSIGVRHLIEGREGFFVTNLVHAQQELPAEGFKVFGTSADNAQQVRLLCVENDRDDDPDEPYAFDEDETIGDLVLTLEPGLPKGAPIEVRIAFSETGRISVLGRDETHGKEVTGELDYGTSVSSRS